MLVVDIGLGHGRPVSFALHGRADISLHDGC